MPSIISKIKKTGEPDYLSRLIKKEPSPKKGEPKDQLKKRVQDLTKIKIQRLRQEFNPFHSPKDGKFASSGSGKASKGSLKDGGQEWKKDAKLSYQQASDKAYAQLDDHKNTMDSYVIGGDTGILIRRSGAVKYDCPSSGVAFTIRPTKDGGSVRTTQYADGGVRVTKAPQNHVQTLTHRARLAAAAAMSQGKSPNKILKGMHKLDKQASSGGFVSKKQAKKFFQKTDEVLKKSGLTF